MCGQTLVNDIDTGMIKIESVEDMESEYDYFLAAAKAVVEVLHQGSPVKSMRA